MKAEEKISKELLGNKHPNYFEGTLQIRNPNEEVINFIKNQFRNNDKVWISKAVKLKTGIDYYVSSNTFLKQIGKKLKKSFKGELKFSKKLFSRNHLTSKEVYRGTVLFRVE